MGIYTFSFLDSCLLGDEIERLSEEHAHSGRETAIVLPIARARLLDADLDRMSSTHEAAPSALLAEGRI